MRNTHFTPLHDCQLSISDVMLLLQPTRMCAGVHGPPTLATDLDPLRCGQLVCCYFSPTNGVQEFMVRNTYIYPPHPSMRIIGGRLTWTFDESWLLM